MRRSYDPRLPAAKKGQAWPEGQEGAEAAQAEGGGGQGRPQADDERGLGVAGGGGVGVRRCGGRCKALAYEVVWPTVLG